MAGSRHVIRCHWRRLYQLDKTAKPSKSNGLAVEVNPACTPVLDPRDRSIQLDPHLQRPTLHREQVCQRPVAVPPELE